MQSGELSPERMRRLLGQPLIIENVSGAEGSIGIGRAARAKPDGYVIDLGQTDNHLLNGALFSLGYDVLNDFAPITALVTVVLYERKTILAKSLQELITWIKAPHADVAIAGADALVLLFFTFLRRQRPQRLSRLPHHFSVRDDIKDLE
jgi:tripartite-type tricarboxylate transporter receptor subunit TctC